MWPHGQWHLIHVSPFFLSLFSLSCTQSLPTQSFIWALYSHDYLLYSTRLFIDIYPRWDFVCCFFFTINFSQLYFVLIQVGLFQDDDDFKFNNRYEISLSIFFAHMFTHLLWTFLLSKYWYIFVFDVWLLQNLISG